MVISMYIIGLKINVILTFLLFICLTINIGEVGATVTKKTIMIDLDGVLNNYTAYTEEIPSIKGGADKFVKELAKNYDLILFTTRNSKKALEWLQANKIDKYFKDVTNVKIPAFIYLDDRSIIFEGNYDKTLKDIEQFKVYWDKSSSDN